MANNTETIERTETSIEIQKPDMYKVILHNDDFTSMEFVIAVLTTIFHRKSEDAITVTLAVHEQGEGIAGAPYTKEIAEQKTIETTEFARANNFPLKTTFEPL
jgi:ATP-dependent Clp protease adaptor protein ClpS